MPPTNSEQPKTPTQKQTPPKQQQQPNNTVPPANSEQPQQKKEVVPPTHSEQPQVPEQTPTPTQQQQPNLDPARGLWGGTVEEDPYFGDEPLTREYDYWIRVLPDTPASCYQVCYPRDVETVNRNDFLNQGIFYPTLSAIFCVQNNNLLGTIDDPNDPHSSLGFVSDFESIKESKMPHQFSEAKIRKILAQLRDIDANNGLPTDCTKISLEFYQVDIAAQEIVTKQEISIPTKTRSISVR